MQCTQFCATSSNAIISKIKAFLWIFYCISEMCMQFRTFWEKRWVSWPNYFRNYGLRKRWLLKRVKGRASEDHAVINVLSRIRIWNLNSNFQTFRATTSNLKSLQKSAPLTITRYPIFPCIWDILSWKKSALVWSEILTLFVNTLTAHNKYSQLQSTQFLKSQQVQTPITLSQK